ncbi:reverse transcriptase [Gossypium australe]|uniref:Reverse transcriptase n=1 Tax=Gossypium australe TaxID=47621 RepID=A0A5B6W9E9_9ROSI|nr:reverse transcriptase [Gossypium australe]
MGGKEVFIKSVLQATSIYAMQCFLFPKSLCRKLESIMNKFWWSNNKTRRGIHWSCWERLCKPKCEEGLGFKNLSISSTKIGSYPSLTWRSICSARELIDEGVLWRVGNGDRINIWNDPWLPGHGNNRVVIQNIRPSWTTINQLIETVSGTWNRELIHHLFDEDTAARIFAIPFVGDSSDDFLT